MDIQLLIGSSGVIACGIAVAALIVSIMTFSIAKKSFLADHERRKKQATIEFYNELSNNASAPFRKAISESLKVPLLKNEYRTILPDDPIWVDDQDLQLKCIKYCRNMERLAVGIKNNIFDYETFYAIAGKSTAQQFLQIYKLIEKEGSANHQKSEFCEEYKKLCRKLLKRLFSEDLDDEKDDKNLLLNSLL